MPEKINKTVYNLKPIPEGNKGKGLKKLPTKVRNNMGFEMKPSPYNMNKPMDIGRGAQKPRKPKTGLLGNPYVNTKPAKKSSMEMDSSHSFKMKPAMYMADKFGDTVYNMDPDPTKGAKARTEFDKKYPGVSGARDIARFRSKKINPGGKESYLIYDDKGLTGIDNPKINPGAKSVSKLQTKAPSIKNVAAQSSIISKAKKFAGVKPGGKINKKNEKTFDVQLSKAISSATKPIQTVKKEGTFKNIKAEGLTSLPAGIPKSKPSQAKVKPVKKKKFKSQTGKKLKPFKYKTKNKGKKVVFK